MQMTTTVLDQVVRAMREFEAAHNKKPTRILMPENLHKEIHEAARAAGCFCPMYPATEDERLECKGMKVYCHKSENVVAE